MFTRRACPDRLPRSSRRSAPGVLLAGEPAFTLVARQYHERVFEFDGGVFLHGNVVAPFIWSLLIAVRVRGRGRRRRSVPSISLGHGEWRAIVRSRLALPAVVAMGFFVRVITLLTVLPERTDDGDPLFYHTTANVLARGRGFLEPLRLERLRDPPAQRVPWSAVPGRAVDQLALRRHELLRPQDDVDRHRHGGRAGGRDPRASDSAAPLVGLAAAAFAAVYPNLWQIDSLLYPEGLMALLVTVTMILAYRWRDRPRLVDGGAVRRRDRAGRAGAWRRDPAAAAAGRAVDPVDAVAVAARAVAPPRR